MPAPVRSYRPSLPPVGDNALLWKEKYHGSLLDWGEPRPLDRLAQRWDSILSILLPSAGFFYYMHWAHPGFGNALVGVLNPVIRFLTVILAGIGCIGVALRAAVSFSRERDQRTLPVLLLLPIERKEIVRAKWLGSLLRWRECGLVLVLIWLTGLATGVLHAWSVLLLAVSCAAYVSLLASLGVWLSLAARNTRWALISAALILLLLFIGVPSSRFRPSYLFASADPMSWLEGVVYFSLHPIRAWLSAVFSWKEGTIGLVEDSPSFRLSVFGIGMNWILCSVLAYLFWRLACRRLARESIERSA